MLWRLLKDLFFPGRESGSAADATERADRLIAEGHRADSRGDAREACEHYSKAVDCAPRYPAAHFNLGMGLAALGDIDGAIGSFRVALTFDPANAQTNYNLGNLLFRRGALEEAERCVRRAIELKFEVPEAYVVLSNVLGKLGRLTDAEAALRHAIEIDPRFFAAYRNLGVVLLGQSRVDEAVEILRAGQKLDPDGFDLESAELFASISRERSPATPFFPDTRRSVRGWKKPILRGSSRSETPGIPTGACASAMSRAIFTPTPCRFSSFRCWNATTGLRTRSIVIRSDTRWTRSRGRCARARMSGATRLRCPMRASPRRSTATGSTSSSIFPAIAAFPGLPSSRSGRHRCRSPGWDI